MQVLPPLELAGEDINTLFTGFCTANEIIFASYWALETVFNEDAHLFALGGLTNYFEIMECAN